MEKYVLIIPISCARSAQEIGIMRTYVMTCKRIGINMCAKRTSNRRVEVNRCVNMCAKRTKNRCRENDVDVVS